MNGVSARAAGSADSIDRGCCVMHADPARFAFALLRLGAGALLGAALGFRALAAHAQVVTFEGIGVFPESDPIAPWTRIAQGTPAQRWLDNGVFCQTITD